MKQLFILFFFVSTIIGAEQPKKMASELNSNELIAEINLKDNNAQTAAINLFNSCSCGFNCSAYCDLLLLECLQNSSVPGDTIGGCFAGYVSCIQACIEFDY